MKQNETTCGQKDCSNPVWHGDTCLKCYLRISTELAKDAKPRELSTAVPVRVEAEPRNERVCEPEKELD